jgi:hypothetical protein
MRVSILITIKKGKALNHGSASKSRLTDGVAEREHTVRASNVVRNVHWQL